MPNAKLSRLLEDPEAFLWAVGIEDTFIVEPWPQSGRTLDEYELTGHYDRWREDLDLMASLGVKWARYGIPWYRINPAPGQWDWAWSERALERLLALGIEPILDLVHYGVPSWIEGAYLHPDYPERVAEYAERSTRLCGGALRWFTPLNEPRITAWYCGRIGWWPPRLKGWRGFLRVLLGVCRGIVRTTRAVRAAVPEAVIVHVDAADFYRTEDPSLEAEVRFRQHLCFLPLDLVCGRVRPGHPLLEWMLRHGAPESDLGWLAENAEPPDLAGVNMYPMFSNKNLVRAKDGLRLRSPYGSSEMVESVLRMFAQRSGLPVLISETAARGPRRLAWLRESVAAVRNLRAEGVACVGYTWWPMLALVAWAYRQSLRPVHHYIEPFGLWDFDPADLSRVPTELVGIFRELVGGGAEAVGRLVRRKEGARVP